MTHHDHDQVDREREGVPGRGGLTDADTAGAGAASPGGAVVGEAGVDDSLGAPGADDLGGDSDLGGGAGLSVASQTAGGDAAADDAMLDSGGGPAERRPDTAEGEDTGGIASAAHASERGEGPPGERRVPDAG